MFLCFSSDSKKEAHSQLTSIILPRLEGLSLDLAYAVLGLRPPHLVSVVLLMFKSRLTGHNIIQTVSLPTPTDSSDLPPPSLLPGRGRTARLLLYISNCNEIYLTLQSSD